MAEEQRKQIELDQDVHAALAVFKVKQGHKTLGDAVKALLEETGRFP